MTIFCADCGRAVDGVHLCDMRLHDLVPGYLDSADGLKDAADQRKADR